MVFIVITRYWCKFMKFLIGFMVSDSGTSCNTYLCSAKVYNCGDHQHHPLHSGAVAAEATRKYSGVELCGEKKFVRNISLHVILSNTEERLQLLQWSCRTINSKLNNRKSSGGNFCHRICNLLE